MLGFKKRFLAERPASAIGNFARFYINFTLKIIVINCEQLVSGLDHAFKEKLRFDQQNEINI